MSSEQLCSTLAFAGVMGIFGSSLLNFASV